VERKGRLREGERGRHGGRSCDKFKERVAWRWEVDLRRI